MAISTSVGFSKLLLTGTQSATELFALGKIKVWSGEVPADASAAVGTVQLEWTITKTSGTPSGLTFESGTTGSRALVKKIADTWGGEITGTPAAATFFRLLQAADDGEAVDTDGAYARIQGTVGIAGSGADFIVANTTFALGTKNLSAFSMQIP